MSSNHLLQSRQPLEKNWLGEMSYAWTQDQRREGGTRDRPGATPSPGENQLQAQEPTSIWEAGVMGRGLQGWASPGGLGLLPGPPADPELSVTRPSPALKDTVEGQRGIQGIQRDSRGFGYRVAPATSWNPMGVSSENWKRGGGAKRAREKRPTAGSLVCALGRDSAWCSWRAGR